MSAKRENLICRERHNLEDVLPLETPYSINIDPCNICNFSCKFCAIQTSEEPLNFKKQMMSFDLFQKIVDDISMFPDKLKLFGMAGNGEPLLNPDFPKMARYAKDRDISLLVETNTNGSKLNPEFNQALIDCGIDRIRISVEAISEEGYCEIAGAKIDLERFIANIRDLHDRSMRVGGSCQIYIKTVDAAVETEEKQEKFYQLFEDVCDQIFIDHVIPLWADWKDIYNRFDIQEVGVQGQCVQRVQVCPYPFYSLCITPDGMVVLCCADWRRELIVGDLNKQTMLEIWNGEVLRTFWINMLSGRKDQYAMCQKCQLPRFNCNDNIDRYAGQILKRIRPM